MPNSKKRRKLVVFSLAGVVLIGGLTLALTHKREIIIPVQTEKVARRNITETVVANGKIQPVVQVTISPEVSGEIVALPVKEGQKVKKGDLIVKIKPDTYIAARNQAEAGYQSARASQTSAEASLHKAQADFKRNEGLFKNKLISDSAYDESKAAYEVAAAQLNSAQHQVDMSHASLASAEEELAKTTIVAPRDGTVSKLNCEVGERVLGTVQNAGTLIMTISDFDAIEARVDIGEMDVVLIKPGQKARLDVDAFKDKKFSGVVTEIANSAKGSGTSQASSASSSTSQEATKFEVRIRVNEIESFRPGMSVTAYIETRSCSNALTVPIASVTTRVPPSPGTNGKAGVAPDDTNCAPALTNTLTLAHSAPGRLSVPTNAAVTNTVGTNALSASAHPKEAPKPVEVVFVVEGDHVKTVPVKIGISDDSYWEITSGLKEGDQVVSGSYRAIARDLDDGKKIKKGGAGPEMAGIGAAPKAN
jgi:HlyD family secretion protein